MSLTIEEILAANDASVKKVECPEWGGCVYIRTLTADERDAWELQVSNDGRPRRATLVAAALCDENGTPLTMTAAQVDGLGHKASGPVDRIADAIMSHNAMRAEDMEKLEKNSEGTATPD